MFFQRRPVFKSKYVNRSVSNGINETYPCILQFHSERSQSLHLYCTFLFVSFKLMDLKSRMYVASGMSLKSEKEAFDRAMDMLKHINVEINSVRLDKYYSFPSLCG